MKMIDSQYRAVGTPVLLGKYWSTFSIGLQYFPHGTGNAFGVVLCFLLENLRDSGICRNIAPDFGDCPKRSYSSVGQST